jgi:hypothetical protein
MQIYFNKKKGYKTPFILLFIMRNNVVQLFLP